MLKIIDLDIDAFLSGDTKIEEIGLVFNPAIELDWVYFNSQEQQFESYDDYPQAARDNACRAVRWSEENGWGDCGEATGKRRASQLCNGEMISEETIARMASFRRHQQHKDVPYDEGCGGLMWDAWGGEEGIEWASRKLEQIREERMSSQCGCSIDNKPEEFVDSAMGISVGDYVSWTYAGRSEDADRGRGQVKDVRVQGEVQIPDTDLTLTATEDRPVALIETRDGKIVGQYIDGDMRVIQKPDNFSHSQIHALIEAERLGCKGTHFMGDEWHPCETHKEYEEALQREKRSDEQMIEGVIDILLQIDNIENRAMVAIDILKDFDEEGVEYDYDLFLERIGLLDEDLEYLWDDTMELEDLLEQGYVITEAKEINPLEVVEQYKDEFNKKGITEEQFYRLSSKPNEPSVMDGPFSLRRYVYSIGPQGGPDLIPTSREFCRRMLGRRQLVWRFEDIQMLSTQLNAEDRDNKIIPRPKGAGVNVFVYAGGANCRHRWLELALDPGERVKNNKQRAQKDSIITLDAPGQSGQLNEPVQYGRTRNPNTLREESMSSKDIPVGFLQGVPVYQSETEAKGKSVAMGCEGVYEKVDYMGKECFRPCRTMRNQSFKSEEYSFKLDEEKRMIYAPAMIPNKLIRRYEPGEGEYFVRFNKEAIERGAHKFLMEGRTTPEFVNYEHSDKKFEGIWLVESWIVNSENDKIYDYGYSPEDVPEGSWIVGYKVENDELWNDYVKKGLIKAVSVEGLFDMKFSKEEMLLNEIINILSEVSPDK